jgi:peptidyl-prolyl cis-trans isomerase C
MNPAAEAVAPPRRNRVREIVGGIAREPLTHFLLIGLVIFLAATAVKASQRPVLRIDTDELNQLASYWEMQMQRPPNKDELQGIIRERIDEEILAREAVRLGMDRDDMIIRRRLAQKMSFASEDVTAAAEPDETALRAYYDKTKTAYLAPAHVAIRHVYFSADRAAADAQAAATRALGDLRAGRPNVGGDPSVLPLAYADVSLSDLARDYGVPFAHTVETGPLGIWQGPIQSAYGWHLLRVETRHPAAVAPFATVRAEVRDAYLADRRRIDNAAYMDKLRQRYRIEVAEAPR